MTEIKVFTPDELVAQIFAIQNERHPDDDPGDIAIDIQDDSALRAVWQAGKMMGMGGSIQEALESALEHAQEDSFLFGPSSLDN